MPLKLPAAYVRVFQSLLCKAYPRGLSDEAPTNGIQAHLINHAINANMRTDKPTSCCCLTQLRWNASQVVLNLMWIAHFCLRLIPNYATRVPQSIINSSFQPRRMDDGDRQEMFPRFANQGPHEREMLALEALLFHPLFP